ncbi:3-oxoacyl-[acyl-carrier protein] reductase [Lentzea atacamensis]|uniref:3-oxoacyl-[acyl-carrier protein] reductase n=1 Tax=Lentzea atacamensis TaxID=531938 RepID=A0A316IC28_9PSEU|nr:3-oxoacyl-ACP reductase [Lentzea atacamensis]PWK90549.1 3-oxoacyl-[acyl-carrier protein] reductase [Lentzea atacamensis]
MDRYQKFASSGLGRQLVRRLGLPNPYPLRRDAAVATPVLVGGAGRLPFLKQLETGSAPYGALVFDASDIASVADLRQLHDFFHPVITQLGPCGRVIVIGRSPDSVAQRALEGFVRSVGKELRRGGTANLVHVADGAEDGVESTLRFLLSGRSAYVSGQVIHVSGNASPGSLEGKVALVTGASRGIGEAIATTLGRDGAHVICLDVPAVGDELSKVANAVGGSALQLDITGDPARLTSYLLERHGGVDIVVHNAGITRDKTLARMDSSLWDAVLEVNLACQERINAALLEGDVLRAGGRIVGVSSIAGIAGNVGQTNYATSKAGVIGMVNSLAPVLAARGATINAVAPGFIETKMTAAVPLMTREVGRRMNSLSQGGLPVDVAETVAWFASPGSGGVNGNVVRVCGQMLLGA